MLLLHSSCTVQFSVVMISTLNTAQFGTVKFSRVGYSIVYCIKITVQCSKERNTLGLGTLSSKHVQGYIVAAHSQDTVQNCTVS